jgi:hypothetical protein
MIRPFAALILPDEVGLALQRRQTGVEARSAAAGRVVAQRCRGDLPTRYDPDHPGRERVLATTPETGPIAPPLRVVSGSRSPRRFCASDKKSGRQGRRVDSGSALKHVRADLTVGRMAYCQRLTNR